MVTVDLFLPRLTHPLLNHTHKLAPPHNLPGQRPDAPSRQNFHDAHVRLQTAYELFGSFTVTTESPP